MLRWTRPDDLLGVELEGRFRIVRLIGQGGMGAVFEALHLRLDVRVAIKVLEPRLAEDPRQRQRFLREARAAARIPSDHVVKIMDFGEEPLAFFVMEFLDGRDLAAILRDEGRLDWRRAQALVLPVMQALHAAHEVGIIHRDVKPSNILVATRPGGSDAVKVLDFGIAKVAETGLEQRGLTRSSELLGTLSYISPEQCLAKPVDCRSDIYSLGIVLFELLTGHVPFTGSSLYEICAQHINATRPDVCAEVPTIPRALGDLIRRAMAPHADDRMAAMDEFANALVAVERPPRPGELDPTMQLEPAPVGPVLEGRTKKRATVRVDLTERIASEPDPTREADTGVHTSFDDTTLLSRTVVIPVQSPNRVLVGKTSPVRVGRGAALLVAALATLGAGVGAYRVRSTTRELPDIEFVSSSAHPSVLLESPVAVEASRPTVALTSDRPLHGSIASSPLESIVEPLSTIPVATAPTMETTAKTGITRFPQPPTTVTSHHAPPEASPAWVTAETPVARATVERVGRATTDEAVIALVRKRARSVCKLDRLVTVRANLSRKGSVLRVRTEPSVPCVEEKVSSQVFPTRAKPTVLSFSVDP